MNLSPEQLREISSRTLDHYDSHADEFREGTHDHDVSQNIEALLRHIEARPPFRILDFGCGPGRDLKTFTRLGHLAIGLEGSARFAEMARRDSGCAVWEQDFLKLDLPNCEFDGVFANAALFHVPSQEMPRVLAQLRECLKPRGVLFSSNPRGSNEEGWSDDDRYGAYFDLDRWRSLMSEAGLVEIDHYYWPAGLPREKQPWLASVWRKPWPKSRASSQRNEVQGLVRTCGFARERT